MEGTHTRLYADHLLLRLDYASSTVQYQGSASPGTSTASSSWQIKRLTLDSSGRITTVEFADGDANFNNSWDSRATLSYS